MLNAPPGVDLDIPTVFTHGDGNFQDSLGGHNALDKPSVEFKQRTRALDEINYPHPRVEGVVAGSAVLSDHVVTESFHESPHVSVGHMAVSDRVRRSES